MVGVMINHAPYTFIGTDPCGVNRYLPAGRDELARDWAVRREAAIRELEQEWADYRVVHSDVPHPESEGGR